MSPNAETLRPEEVRAVIFLGGPSAERDISLDSARTFYDALHPDLGAENLELVHVEGPGQWFRLQPGWVYSNTVDDYRRAGERALLPLDPEQCRQLVEHAHVLCSLVHGAYGEDGALAAELAAMGRSALLGSPAAGLALTLDKHATLARLEQLGLPTVRRRLLGPADSEALDPAGLVGEVGGSPDARVVVKPNAGGSSDGVSLVGAAGLVQAIAAAREHGPEVLVEERIRGTEFSLILLQDLDGRVLPLWPTEVELQDNWGGIEGDRLYSRLAKYMPGYGVRHHTPARFDDERLAIIREQAAQLFTDLELQDWARFDGFLCEDGRILWSDLNGAPGFGMDSFLFQQASQFGLDARGASRLLLSRAAGKEGLRIDWRQRETSDGLQIAVVGGGTSSERHVSRMSWINVLHKLESLGRDRVQRIFIDRSGAAWHVPHMLSLQHTVEEIEAGIADPAPSQRAVASALEEWRHVSAELCALRTVENPAPMALDLEQVARAADFVFLALHGGMGEDGTIQEQLRTIGTRFNGSGAEASRLCMDKFATGTRAREAAIPGLTPGRQVQLPMASLRHDLEQELGSESLATLCSAAKEHGLAVALDNPIGSAMQTAVSALADSWRAELHSPHGLVIKPLCDGCSSGVLVSRGNGAEVAVYLLAMLAGLERVPLDLLYGPDENRAAGLLLEMPPLPPSVLLLEELLADPAGHMGPPNRIELTCGVLGRAGDMHALWPSGTPSSQGFLTVEEKFCKGMGTNLTPPPELDEGAVIRVRERLSALANALDLDGYARIDAIYDLSTDELHLIEVNTLPGMSAATVLFTQAQFTPGVELAPAAFVRHLVELGMGEPVL
ncbi:MAG: D-alanine--D-alanine ligase [Planctomycetota bacterium]